MSCHVVLEMMHIKASLDIQRLSSIVLMIMTAVITYFISQYYIFDLTKGFIISAVNSLTFSALANVVFITSIYVLLEGFGLMLSSTVTFRDVESLAYALAAAALTWFGFLVAGAFIGFSVGFQVDGLNWILLPVLVLVALGNPAQFLIIVAIGYVGIDATLNYFKRIEV